MRQQSMFGSQWAMNRLNNPNARSVGLYGECLLNDVLSKKGYIVLTPKSGEKRGDLRVIDPESGEVLAIEVKTSRRGKAGRWQWTLWKKNSQNHRHSDIVILLAVCKIGLPIAFVIPTDDIRHLHSIKIHSHPLEYSGKYAQYRQQLRKLSLGAVL